MSTYTPKDIVLACMKFIIKETRYIDQEKKVYLVYECPKDSCKARISFMDKSGYRNPYMHLVRCYGKGKEDKDAKSIVDTLYRDARKKQREKGGSIRSHFISGTLSEYEKAIYCYLKYIILKDIPIRHIESSEFRNLSKFNFPISAKTLTSVILQLVVLVENIIIHEISGKKGALMHDGWKCNGTYYVGLYITYTVELNVVRNNNQYQEHTTKCTLISLSPLARIIGMDLS